jgi:hypothetical protein
MQVSGNYREDGYALVEGLLPPEVTRAFLRQLRSDFKRSGIDLGRLGKESNLLRRPAVEIYGYHYPPMLTFLWALTPIIAELTGADLLPSYDYFRIYGKDDVCRVHCDRYSCEHSVSLTLDYSDGLAWPLEIGREAEAPSARVEEDFAGTPYSSLAMKPGDAVLYRGVEHRHGRMTPNPNTWSAHLFLHWVDRDGPYAAHAFEGERNVEAKA